MTKGFEDDLSRRSILREGRSPSLGKIITFTCRAVLCAAIFKDGPEDRPTFSVKNLTPPNYFNSPE